MANFVFNSLLNTVSKARCWRHRYKGGFLSPFPEGLQSPGEHGQVNNDRDPATWEQPEYPGKTSDLDLGRGRGDISWVFACSVLTPSIKLPSYGCSTSAAGPKPFLFLQACLSSDCPWWFQFSRQQTRHLSFALSQTVKWKASQRLESLSIGISNLRLPSYKK